MLSLALMVGGMLALTAGSAPAGAYPSPNVVLEGHGWGGGFGMGQWGALGYAVDGYDSTQIITHFYGKLANGQATTMGSMPNGWSDTGTAVTVGINENAGNDVIVTSASAFTVQWSGGSANVPAGGGALFHLVSATAPSWNVFTNAGAGANGACGGGSAGWAQVAAGVAGPVAVPGAEPFPADANLATEVLQLCVAGGNIALRGSVGGAVNSNGLVRTVDQLPLGQYLADVVPAESPTAWGSVASTDPAGDPPPTGTPGGDGWGFQELEAQAVAARSYVMSTYGTGDYGGYADICDTTQCQAYPGIADESSTADNAVTATADQVVLVGSTVEQTPYSSSTGGYSAPSLFAAVPDDGDAVCIDGTACNPHHEWTATIPVTQVEAAYPQLGTLESVDVTQRNGLGEWGGRVIEMTLGGSRGTVMVSGDQFAAQFAGDAVQSNWFIVEGQPSGGVSGYWVVGNDGGIFAFGAAAFHGSMGGQHLVAPVVGMAATADHQGYWEVASDGGIFAFGDAAFHGSMGGQHLNAPMLGMAAASGGGYWTVAQDGGIFAFGGAPFDGSMGGQHLNAPMVGMAADPAGGYWTVASDGGVFSFGGAGFFGSTGSMQLNAPVVGLAPTPDGKGYWLLASDGGVFAFGDAAYQGSLPGLGLQATAAVLMPDVTGQGYDIVTTNGEVLAFGDAPQLGQPLDYQPSDTMVDGAIFPQ